MDLLIIRLNMDLLLRKFDEEYHYVYFLNNFEIFDFLYVF